MQPDAVNILLVDDDDIAIMGMKRVLKKRHIDNPLFVASDGIEALDLLRGATGSGVPKPYLILLDLNMPRMNGFEFLEAIRNDEEFKRSIVFVLTTSNDEQDKLRAYEKNVAGFVVKTDIETTYMQTLDMLDSYWNIVEFPC
jgi:CheY-like chemotaxis protein